MAEQEAEKSPVLMIIWIVVLFGGCCWFAVFGQDDVEEMRGDSGNDTNVVVLEEEPKGVRPQCTAGAPCLKAESAPFVVVGTSKDVLNEYGKRLERARRNGVSPFKQAQDLFEDGQIFMVPEVRVTVMERGFTNVKVRLEEGDHKGELVWTPSEFLVE